MSDTRANPNAQQIDYWNNEAGPRWVAMQERMDTLLAPVLHAALEHAAPKPGEAVLDIGCGCGASVLGLAERVGAAGRVTGVDVSAPMLDRARQRAAEAGLQNAELVLSDAATHAFPAGAFDLVFSRFGVMFFIDPTAAFANIRSGLSSAGRVSFACWAPPQDNPWLTKPLEAARPHMPPQPKPDPDAPGPFAFANPDRVRGILAGAGYSEIDLTRHDFSMRLGGPGGTEQAARFALEAGPVSRLMADATPEAREAAGQAILAEFRRLETPDGIALPGSIWLVSAHA